MTATAIATKPDCRACEMILNKMRGRRPKHAVGCTFVVDVKVNSVPKPKVDSVPKPKVEPVPKPTVSKPTQAPKLARKKDMAKELKKYVNTMNKIKAQQKKIKTQFKKVFKELLKVCKKRDSKKEKEEKAAKKKINKEAKKTLSKKTKEVKEVNSTIYALHTIQLMKVLNEMIDTYVKVEPVACGVGKAGKGKGRKA